MPAVLVAGAHFVLPVGDASQAADIADAPFVVASPGIVVGELRYFGPRFDPKSRFQTA